MALEGLIKNKFKEVYGVYNAFVARIKELVDDSKSIEIDVVLLDAEEKKGDGQHSEEKKTMVRELFVKMMKIQTLQMDLSRISNELIGYYRILIAAGISLDLEGKELEGLNTLAENVGTLVYAVDKGKVVPKQQEMEDMITKNIAGKGDQPIVDYINTMRVNPMYNKIIADNANKA